MKRKLLDWGHRFSRDCFLCLGGAMVLIAVGGLVGNLPGLIKPGDLSLSEVSDLSSIISFFAVSGIVFLAVAYGLFRRKPWGAHLAAVVSALALAFLIVSWLRETEDPEGYAIILSFYSVPLLFTLVWALAETVREVKEQKTARGIEGQGNHIA